MWMRPHGQRALADALAGARKHAGLTQSELASRLRIDRTTLLDMEAGRNKALSRWSEAMAELGYDVVVVPRGSAVTVREPEAVPAEGEHDASQA